MDGRDLNAESKGMRVWWGTKGLIEPYLDKKPMDKVIPLNFVVRFRSGAHRFSLGRGLRLVSAWFVVGGLLLELGLVPALHFDVCVVSGCMVGVKWGLWEV